MFTFLKIYYYENVKVTTLVNLNWKHTSFGLTALSGEDGGKRLITTLDFL